jgi:hypothetical protein
MRQEVTHGGLLARRADRIVAGRRIELLQHLQGGQVFFGRIVEGDAALLDELHQGTDVTALVIEATRNSASVASGRPVATSATPNAPW